DKIIISQQDIERLCNEIMPNSFKSISKINYKKLNSRSIRLVGCYGRNELIAKFLLVKDIINKENYESIILSFADNLSREVMPSLRPGIYLQQVLSIEKTEKANPLFLVIHWSENGCYDDSASSYRKKNMTNLHRYLTKLTDRQICLMSERDLECIDWQIISNEENDYDSEEEDEDDGLCYDFEVKKSQEQKEDFEIFPGFRVNISGLEPRQAPRSDYLNNIPLNSLVVDSVSNQTFITREIIPETKFTGSGTILFKSTYLFREYFKSKLETQKCALILDANLKMSNLEVIVKDGLGLEEILQPYYDELDKLDQEKFKRKEQQIKIIKKDALLIEKLALHMLKLEYSEFEKYLHGEYDVIEEDDIQYIQENYPEIVSKLEEVIKFIDHEPWIDLKCRFHLAKYFSENNAEDVSYEPISDQRQYFLEIFSDNSTSIYNLVKKYKKTTNSWSTSLFKPSKTNDIVKKIKEEASQISDGQFVKNISHDEQIVNAFYDEYVNWRKRNLLNSIQKILPKHPSTRFSWELDREFNHEEHELEIREVARICSEVNKMYPEGELLKIKGLEKISSYWNTESYRLFRETETLHPAQLRITIYGTRISQEDSMELEKDEFFIPTPLLHSSGRNPGVSFEIDPETYEFINISQFDKKFLVILWNKVKYGNKMELYFDSLQRLPKMIELQTPIKKLNSGPNSKIAINDSKGLIAIYSPEKALVLQEELNDIEMTDAPISDAENERVNNEASCDNTEEISDAITNNTEEIYKTISDKDEEINESISDNAEEINESISDTEKRNEANSELLYGSGGSDFVNAHIYFVEGFIKIENNKSLTILGKDTMFKRDFRIGDYLIIGEEKRQVSEIVYDNVLKIVRPSFENVKFGQWLSFGIEQITTNNGLIDVYAMVFTKYATTTPIGQIDKPLKATFVVDVSRSSKTISTYEAKIRKYVDKMFEKVKKETKKPSGHLKHFKSAYAIFENLTLDDESTEYLFGEVCDWGNIQATLITMRALEIKKFLSDAISFGYEQKEEDPFSDYEAPENANTDLDGLEQRVKPLQGRDDGTLIPDDVVLLSEIFDDIDESVNLMHDTGLVLLQNGKDFVELSNDTVHGNMLMTTFTCEEEEFEFEGHRLNVGDHGDFVLCHKLCENMGRHRHIDFCKDPGVCESEGGSRKEGVLEHIKGKKMLINDSKFHT
ncbi:15286_t:CDS:10, partial [Funneliformis mosseae]